MIENQVVIWRVPTPEKKAAIHAHILLYKSTIIQNAQSHIKCYDTQVNTNASSINLYTQIYGLKIKNKISSPFLAKQYWNRVYYFFCPSQQLNKRDKNEKD